MLNILLELSRNIKTDECFSGQPHMNIWTVVIGISGLAKEDMNLGRDVLK